MLTFLQTLAVTCTVVLNQLPASGGSGPAVVSYQNVNTGERTASVPADCRVAQAENGARQDGPDTDDNGE